MTSRHLSPDVVGKILQVDRLSRTVGGQSLMPTLSFSLVPGRILFFQGPSGCGKSTTLRLLASLDTPDPTPWAPITFDGSTPSDLTIPVWRSHVTLVPQTRVSLVGTPLDLFHRVLKFSVRAHARQLPGVEEYVNTCASLGLTRELLEKEWDLLSGGEAQRATIAIALTLKPEVLLLDEITSALDMESTRKVELAVAEACRRGATVCWVSHDTQQVGRMQDLIPHVVSVLPFDEPVESNSNSGGLLV